MNKIDLVEILATGGVPAAIALASWKSAHALGSFLKRIGGPAVDELALLLRDKVSHWRLENFLRQLKQTEALLDEHQAGTPESRPHPRVLHEVISDGSWVDDGAVEGWWAGLLASGCTEDGGDDSNLVFTNILGQMTTLQARLMNLAVERSREFLTCCSDLGQVRPTRFVEMTICTAGGWLHGRIASGPRIGCDGGNGFASRRRTSLRWHHGAWDRVFATIDAGAANVR